MLLEKFYTAVDPFGVWLNHPHIVAHGNLESIRGQGSVDCASIERTLAFVHCNEHHSGK